MADATQTPDQLPALAGISAAGETIAWEPGGPTSKLPLKLLLGRLISTEEATATVADLQPLLNYDANAMALVFADPDASKCGWYRKVGPAGGGNWVQFETLSSAALASVVEAAADVNATAARLQAQVADLATRSSLSVDETTSIGRSEGVALVDGFAIFQAAFYQRDAVAAAGMLTSVDVFDRAASSANAVGVYRSVNGATTLVAQSTFTTTGAHAEVHAIPLANALAVLPGDILAAATTDQSYTYASGQADGAGYIFGSGPGLPATLTANDVETGFQIQFRFNITTSVQVVTAAAFDALKAAVEGGGEAETSAPIFTDGRTLSAFRAKLATYLATGVGVVRMLITGDSWTAHPPIAAAFANLLYAGPHPVGAKAGDGYIAADAESGGDEPAINGIVVTYSSGWSSYDASNSAPPPAVGCGLDGQTIFTDKNTETLTIQNVVCTIFTIWYAKASGTFRYRVDGGAWTSVTGDGSNALGTVTIGGLALAAHEIDIDTTGNAGTAALLGYYASSSPNGLEIWKAGNGGAKGSDYALFADTYITPIASQFPPDVVIVILTTNDIVTPGQTPAVMIAGIAKVVAAYRRANPQCGFVLISPAQAYGPTDKLPRSAYRDAIYAFAVQNGCEFYNMNDDWDLWAVENARGQWLNQFHIDPAGALRLTRDLARGPLRL